MSPQLSLIVPAHNESNFLEPTLIALNEAGNQLQLDFELIVVNDDSSDDTAQIAERNQAQVVNVKLRNIGAVRNAGAAAAAGKWLVFIDADTLVPVKTLAATMQSLESGHVGGGAMVDLDDLSVLPFTKRMMYHLIVLMWQRISRLAAGCYMFCDSKSFHQFGGFDERYFAAEEYFFSKSLKRLGKFELIKAPVITSARKLHSYSVWQLARFLIRPIFSTKGFFRTKAGLEILYEDQR